MADKEIVTSIKDISIKLENINNTIRNSKQESTKASMDYDKIIQDLVMNIDNKSLWLRIIMTSTVKFYSL